MCGIAGFWGHAQKGEISRDVLQSMTDSIQHRGPNDSGCVLFDAKRKKNVFFQNENDRTAYTHGSIGLGHRRLSILDLSARGRQPISDAQQHVWLTYNGEVYNYLELRQELQTKGHVFQSTSDTEVVLASYLEWGTDCFKRFNGMWALALYDTRSEQLILSRDRFGKKPLYYYQDASALVFASEIKALFQYPSTPRAMNLLKVLNYAGRHYRYVDNDNESFFENIFQVPKSTCLVIEKDGQIKTIPYWTLNPNDQFRTASEADIQEQFFDLLKNAISIRLRSDVPVGVLLSGGLDSTSIAALAAPQNDQMVAFSGVTGDGAYDESAYIRSVIEKTGIRSQFLQLKPAPLVSTLRKMMTFHDEPVCTVTWYSMFLLSEQIAEHGIRVVLTGHGGDELLAGYWDHYHHYFADLRASGKDDADEKNRWLANHQRGMEEYQREKQRLSGEPVNVLSERGRFSSYLKALTPGLLQADRSISEISPFAPHLSRRLYLELFSETVPASLRAEDRNMMAFSIENRVPFLDYRLAEFCLNIGNEYKIRGGLGKWLLRDRMKGILPEQVRTRKDKMGFVAPADEWFRQDVRPQLEEFIAKKNPINETIYHRPVIQSLFQDHLNGANHAMFFWQYLNMHVWYETFFETKNK